MVSCQLIRAAWLMLVRLTLATSNGKPSNDELRIGVIAFINDILVSIVD
jgi:hypothetical protein